MPGTTGNNKQSRFSPAHESVRSRCPLRLKPVRGLEPRSLGCWDLSKVDCFFRVLTGVSFGLGIKGQPRADHVLVALFRYPTHPA